MLLNTFITLLEDRSDMYDEMAVITPTTNNTVPMYQFVGWLQKTMD